MRMLNIKQLVDRHFDFLIAATEDLAINDFVSYLEGLEELVGASLEAARFEAHRSNGMKW